MMALLPCPTGPSWLESLSFSTETHDGSLEAFRVTPPKAVVLWLNKHEKVQPIAVSPKPSTFISISTMMSGFLWNGGDYLGFSLSEALNV